MERVENAGLANMLFPSRLENRSSNLCRYSVAPAVAVRNFSKLKPFTVPKQAMLSSPSSSISLHSNFHMPLRISPAPSLPAETPIVSRPNSALTDLRSFAQHSVNIHFISGSCTKYQFNVLYCKPSSLQHHMPHHSQIRLCSRPWCPIHPSIHCKPPCASKTPTQ